jgi:hypothetical protein
MRRPLPSLRSAIVDRPRRRIDDLFSKFAQRRALAQRAPSKFEQHRHHAGDKSAMINFGHGGRAVQATRS